MLLMRFSEKIKYAEGEITSKIIAQSMIYAKKFMDKKYM